MKQISDEILMKALELREAGQAPERIFAAFPEAREELEQYFKLAADLRAEADRIAPPSREVLRGALRRAAAAQDISGGVFGRSPFGLRVLAPALAVLLIAFFIDRTQVAAPGPVAIEATNVAQDSFMAAAPAGGEPPSPVVPMAAKMAAVPEAPTPLSEAERIAREYIARGYVANPEPVDFETLDNLLSDASKEKKQALADFKAALEAASSDPDFEAKIAAALEAFKIAIQN